MKVNKNIKQMYAQFEYLKTLYSMNKLDASQQKTLLDLSLRLNSELLKERKQNRILNSVETVNKLQQR